MKIKDLFLRKLAEEPEANVPASTEADASNPTDGEPSVSAESSTEDDLWGEMLDNSDDDEPAGEPDPTAAEADDKGDETPPAEPKAEEPPAEPPKAEEPPAEPSPQAETQPKASEPLNQEQIQAEAKRLRESAMAELTNLYKLTDEEAENLQVSPETELPKLAAQLHMNMIEALHFGLQQQLPQMIEHVTVIKQQQQQAVNSFYEVWPQLKNDAYNEVVLRTMQVYKQLNPNAPLDKVIQEGGAMAMAALKIPAGEQTPAPSQQQQRQTAPPAPLAPGNSTVSQSRGPVNEFEALYEEAVNEGL